MSPMGRLVARADSRGAKRRRRRSFILTVRLGRFPQVWYKDACQGSSRFAYGWARFMKNFRRVLRLSLGYPWTISGIVLSSLLVALLWGGNIGVVYPFVEVIVGGQSLQQWVDKKVDATQRQCAELTSQIAALDPAQPADQRKQASLQDRLRAEEQALSMFRGLSPGIHRYLPRDPFKTLLLMIGALMGATIIKDSMLVVNLLLVERLGQLVLLDLRKMCYRAIARHGPGEPA